MYRVAELILSLVNGFQDRGTTAGRRFSSGIDFVGRRGRPRQTNVTAIALSCHPEILSGHRHTYEEHSEKRENSLQPSSLLLDLFAKSLREKQEPDDIVDLRVEAERRELDMPMVESEVRVVQ